MSVPQDLFELISPGIAAVLAMKIQAASVIRPQLVINVRVSSLRNY